MGETISLSVYSSALDQFFFKKQHTTEEAERKIDDAHYCDRDIFAVRGNMMTAGWDLLQAM